MSLTLILPGYSPPNKPKSSMEHRDNGRTGKHHSEETKRRISEKLKGRIFSKETREKLSKSIREYHFLNPTTEESRRKNSLTHRGMFAKEKHPRWKHFSDEDIKEIIRMYTIELLSLDSIGERFSCSLGPVRRILTSHGIEIRKANDPVYFDRRNPYSNL